MNEIIDNLITTSPLFILIFLEKIIDLRWYKKSFETKNVTKSILPYRITVMLSLPIVYLLSAVIDNWFYNNETMKVWGSLFTFVGVPAVAVVWLIVLYLVERKTINGPLQDTSLTKRSFLTNLILTCSYAVTHIGFILGWLIGCLGDIDWFIGADNSEANLKWLILLLVGVVLIVAVFASIKLVVQRRIVRRKTRA